MVSFLTFTYKEGPSKNKNRRLNCFLFFTLTQWKERHRMFQTHCVNGTRLLEELNDHVDLENSFKLVSITFHTNTLAIFKFGETYSPNLVFARLLDGSVTSFFRIKVCVFLENDKTDLRQFFSGFSRKHLLITTCIEKQCTQPLMLNVQ